MQRLEGGGRYITRIYILTVSIRPCAQLNHPLEPPGSADKENSISLQLELS